MIRIRKRLLQIILRPLTTLARFCSAIRMDVAERGDRVRLLAKVFSFDVWDALKENMNLPIPRVRDLDRYE